MAEQTGPASLGGRLGNLRRAAGMKQEDVAAQLGIGRSAYAYYETGGSLPTLDNLGRLASIYGVTTDYLLGRPELRTDYLTVQDAFPPVGELPAYALSCLPKNEKAMLMWFRQLSQEEQEELIRYLSSHCLGSSEDGLHFSK